jgi:hypothetical protein
MHSRQLGLSKGVYCGVMTHGCVHSRLGMEAFSPKPTLDLHIKSARHF